MKFPKMLQNLLCLLLVFAIMPFFTACQTTNPDGTKNPADYTFLAQTATSLAVTKVLSKAKSPEDRAAKAAVITQVADTLLVATDESTTGADINKLVLSIAGDKEHWILLGAAISVAYDQNRVKVPYSELIKAIAEQAKSTAA